MDKQLQLWMRDIVAVRWWIAFLGAATMVLAIVSGARAQQVYKSPDEAIGALVTTAKADDRKGIMTVLGPGAEEIVSSGDAVADATMRKQFLDAYDVKHGVAMEGDNKAVLIIGPDDWPFPIPLVHQEDGWKFDTAAGREEILYRRIGRNELNAIQASLAYVDAQNEYAQKNVATGAAYAQRIVSTPGKKDGLYWPAEGQGGDVSPLGELVANATSEGYRVGAGRTPFHGYYYKILTRQGPTAQGGAVNYIVNGSMIGGFALVAYPAEYGNSGVMTFLVNHTGTVFEKDLGPGTARIAENMSAFNPDHSWKKVAVEFAGQK